MGNLNLMILGLETRTRTKIYEAAKNPHAHGAEPDRHAAHRRPAHRAV